MFSKQCVSTRLAVCFCLLALALVCTAEASTGSSDTLVWKPKLDSLAMHSRALRGVNAAAATTATESCHAICTTCVCAAEEKLNCCSRETESSFAGCVPGSELALCATHRPVNTCCRRLGK